MAQTVDVTVYDNDIHYFTVTDTTAISKGDILCLIDPRTAVAHNDGEGIPIGVAVEDKVSADGQTKIGVRTRGIVDVVAVDTITVGQMVRLDTTQNQVKAITATLSDLSLAKIFGRALETASAGERIEVYMNTMR